MFSSRGFADETFDEGRFLFALLTFFEPESGVLSFSGASFSLSLRDFVLQSIQALVWSFLPIFVSVCRSAVFSRKLGMSPTWLLPHFLTPPATSVLCSSFPYPGGIQEGL